jgi:hypothetical protein
MVNNLATITENQVIQEKQLDAIKDGIDNVTAATNAKEGAEQIFEENLALKKAAEENKKQTGFLAGLFKKSEEKKDEGGFFGFIKKHWGKLLIALALLLTPLKDLGKAFLSIKDYFANNSWGDIGKDIGVALVAALALKTAGGLLFTTILSSLGLGAEGGLGSALLTGFSKISWGPMIKTMGWAGLAFAVFKGVKAGYEEYEAGGSVKQVFNKGIEEFIETLTLGLLPKGVAESWAKGTTNFFEGAYDFLFDPKTREEFGKSVKDVVRAVIPDTWRKELERIDKEKKKQEMEEGLGGDIRDEKGNLTETGQKKFDEAKTKEGFGKATGGAATAISKGDKEGMRAELNAIFDTMGAKKATGEQASNIRALQKALAMEDAPAPATPAAPAAEPAARVAPKGAVHSPGASSRAAKRLAKAKARRSGGDIPDPPVEEPEGAVAIPQKKWNDVAISPGVSDKGMEGTNWSILGGLKKIKDGILGVWNKIGIDGEPTFTSGRRSAATNKKSGGKKTSQHMRGSAFDLRNNMIPISERDAVFAKLQASLGSKIKGIRHKELDGKPMEHFHFQLAAKGFSGTVDKATGFIAGEDGPERVDIVPLNDPSARMNAMNQVHDDRMASQGGTPSINVVTSNQTNNSSDQSAVLIPANIRPKEIPA